MDEVALLLECSDGGAAPAEQLARELRLALGVRLDCRQVPQGTLPRSELKAKRLVRVD